ncbi:MAG: hypothetical protein K2L60_10845 [Bacteroides sp.]|nr:hypothetical protein [Bacteroides sp.]
MKTRCRATARPLQRHCNLPCSNSATSVQQLCNKRAATLQQARSNSARSHCNESKPCLAKQSP